VATTARAVKSRHDPRYLTTALNIHELIEEQLLYPTLRSHPEAKDIVLEGYQEHHVADLLLKELHDLARSNDQWSAKFKVLKEILTHHIQEEEGTMFGLARGALGRDDLHELGEKMAVIKAEHEQG
jgi:hemerythrin superfamily protein